MLKNEGLAYRTIILVMFSICLIILEAEHDLLTIFNKIGHHSVMSHTLSLGMAFFLNIFGIVLTMGSTHVIAVRPDLFDRELIYLSIGGIFLSLMIENFAQGRNFHAVVECKNKAQCDIFIKFFYHFSMRYFDNL